MLRKLQTKWKVSGGRLFLILCVFAVTGTLTAWLSRRAAGWAGFTEQTHWSRRLLLSVGVLIFGYQVIILLVAALLGQFGFFWSFMKKLWSAGKKK